MLALTFFIAAEIIDARGTVEVRAPGASDFHHATRGEQADDGSRVRTGAASEATLRFADGSQIKVSERSAMLVTHVTAEEKERSAVVLFCGRLWAKIAKHRDPSFDVATPNAVAGVRGTQFTTTVADDGTARVQVDEGTVAVSNDDSAQNVQGGQSTEATDSGVSAADPVSDDAQFRSAHQKNMLANGEAVARRMSQRIDARKAKAQRLTDRQRALRGELATASDSRAAAIRDEMRANAAALSELRERAEGGFGVFDHWAELAADPAFRDSFAGAGYVRGELQRLKKVHASFDSLIAEGTDLSMKSMEKMLDDMHGGKPTLKDKDGSAKDLFDDKP
jgi:hypothetical protein